MIILAARSPVIFFLEPIMFLARRIAHYLLFSTIRRTPIVSTYRFPVLAGLLLPINAIELTCSWLSPTNSFVHPICSAETGGPVNSLTLHLRFHLANSVIALFRSVQIFLPTTSCSWTHTI